MDEGPALSTGGRTAAWIPRALFESSLIVFSVLLALAVDQWRDHRAAIVRGREAVAAIRAELESNRAAVQTAHDFHISVKERLQPFVDKRTLPDESELKGLFEPALLLQTAWLIARDTNALEPMPFDFVLRVSRVYEQQALYTDLARAMSNDVYVDLRRRGYDQAIRQNFASFVVLATDFSSRESRLLRIYDEVLKDFPIP